MERERERVREKDRVSDVWQYSSDIRGFMMMADGLDSNLLFHVIGRREEIKVL